MNRFIPFHVPDIDEDEIKGVLEVLRSGWLTTGPKVQQFEKGFATRIGSPHALAVNSCTAALHLALEAVGVKQGDEVIVPTMTFAATAEVVTYFKAKPVLVDCNPDTLNIDVSQIEKAITSRTKAIIPVHYGGHPCDMDPILELAKNKNLMVIEDAAHAFPANYKGRMVGTLGDITCFSFYATKTMTTGEGGMATTKNQEWASRMRTMSLHGLTRDPWNRYTEQGSWFYEIASPGFKYNMTDLAAALGIAQLQKAEPHWQSRQAHARRYNEGLKDIPEICLPIESQDIDHAWHLYTIRLNLERLRITRNEFLQQLQKHQVGHSVHFIPLHLHPYYRDTYGFQPENFPVASAAFDRILSIPIYPKMTTSDVDRVVNIVRTIIQEHRR